MTWTGIVVLAAAAYAFKALGPLVVGRRTLAPELIDVLGLVSVPVLAGLVLVQTLDGGGRLVIDARVPAMCVAALLVWRRTRSSSWCSPPPRRRRSCAQRSDAAGVGSRRSGSATSQHEERAMTDAASMFKQRQRATWSAGNWDRVAELIVPVGRTVIAAGLEPGMAVLDVGTGSGGNISIPAAQMGAVVTGSDLTPELFDEARRRAAEAGVEVTWVEADAEALPFADDAFDRVFSTFGHMFAPRHGVAASEMARVCRPDGRIATATWTPQGSTGAMFKTLAAYLPPPPEGVESPLAWGVEDHARAIYEPLGLRSPARAPRFTSSSRADRSRSRSCPRTSGPW